MINFKKIISVVLTMTMLIVICSAFTISTYAAAPTKPTPSSPGDGQIVPFYEVWLRWGDVSDETYYTVTLRDISISETSTASLVYHETQVSQNSTYFVVPKSKLTRGHQYRWVVLSNNASGKTCSVSMLFTIETGTTDSHVRTGGFASAQRLEYFIYAETSGYADILNSAAQSWNGVSSKVNLVRTGTPTDGVYEMGVFESPTPTNSNSFGYAKLMVGGSSGTEVTSTTAQYDYAQIQTYRENIVAIYSAKSSTTDFVVNSLNEYLKGNATHEIGHALSLSHTGCKATDSSSVYQICHSTKTGKTMPLVMNSSYETAALPNVVDRDHLRIKWGA